MFRKHVGRLLIVAAGGGCLAVLIFVVLPMTNEPAPPVTRDAIVAEVFPASEAAEHDGLLQVLNAPDVAAAKAGLDGRGPEPVEPLEGGVQDKAEANRALPVVAAETGGPAGDDRSEEVPAASAEPEAAAVVEVEAPETAGEEMTVVPVSDAEVPEQDVQAVVLPADSLPAEGRGRPGDPVRLAVRRGEFDRPVFLDSRALRGASHPSGGVPQFAAAEAAQAGNAQTGLPPRTGRAGVIVPGTLRGVMGYRLPLVSRQEVPDQIVSGVLIPAHTTFVIVKPGAWELIDLTAEEVQALREAAARKERAAAAQAEVAEVEAPWTLWRALRGRRAPARD